MNKLLLLLAFVVGISLIGFRAAQAMPLAALDPAQAGLTIPVAGGCGPGWHRGPYGACRRNGWYGGAYYGGGVAPVPVPGAGSCYGRGWHRVCDRWGRCWRVCN